jgi:hypothetical protein
MLTFGLTIAVLLLFVPLADSLFLLGYSNGDQPGDALVSVIGREPGETRPVLAVTVTNPTDVPVLAALVARRTLAPNWLAGSYDPTAPYAAKRKEFRADAFATFGVVPGQAVGTFDVPVLALARRYLLTAVIGTESEQPRRYRLRVYDADLAKRAAGSGGRLVSASR